MTPTAKTRRVDRYALANIAMYVVALMLLIHSTHLWPDLAGWSVAAAGVLGSIHGRLGSILKRQRDG